VSPVAAVVAEAPGATAAWLVFPSARTGNTVAVTHRALDPACGLVVRTVPAAAPAGPPVDATVPAVGVPPTAVPSPWAPAPPGGDPPPSSDERAWRIA
jgi:hypothetical protein